MVPFAYTEDIKPYMNIFATNTIRPCNLYLMAHEENWVINELFCEIRSFGGKHTTTVHIG
jgi:hypothetical protein